MMLKTLLCDLTDEQIERSGLRERYDAIVGADDAAASHACTGCLGCWMRTPGACVIRDRLGDLGSLLGATDELHIASRCTYGGWSAPVERILDRTLGYLDPRFDIRDGQMHHRSRYDHQMRERVWFYGPSTESERSCARALAAAGSLNRNSELQDIWFPAEPQDIGNETDAPIDTACSPAHRNPQLPRRIALINASLRDDRAITSFILEDFADACKAYARHDAAPDALMPKLSTFAWNRPAAFDPHLLAGFDSIVLGYPLYYGSMPGHVIDLLDALQPDSVLAHGARLYAIAHTDLFEASQAAPSFQVLEQFCRRAGLCWSGGLARGASGMIPATANMPRMGIMRRPLSEATDKLILAVRCGTDAGTIETTAPAPRWAYRLATHVQCRSLAKRAGIQDLGVRVTYRNQYAAPR